MGMVYSWYVLGSTLRVHTKGPWLGSWKLVSMQSSLLLPLELRSMFLVSPKDMDPR